MVTKAKLVSVLKTFLSPLVQSLCDEGTIDIDALTPKDIEIIKEVDASSDKVLIMCYWDGPGKNWSLSPMMDADQEYEALAADMLDAFQRSDQEYSVRVFKPGGEVFELVGETIKVTYHLEPV